MINASMNAAKSLFSATEKKNSNQINPKTLTQIFNNEGRNAVKLNKINFNGSIMPCVRDKKVENR